MIAQQGRVTAIQGSNAVVRVGGTSGCAACDAGKGCGAGVFGRLLKRNPVSVCVFNDIDAQVGQAVEVGIAEERFLALVFRLYILPLLGGLAGAVTGFAVAQRADAAGPAADLLILLGGLAAAAVCLLWARQRLREFPLDNTVHLMREVPANECGAVQIQRTGPGLAKELKNLKR